ncbi:DNA topoisomerase 2-binding protein 1 [Podila epigama]|nr:DNA topoisomerase 2-binding protein 1 [Podila epigama]
MFRQSNNTKKSAPATTTPSKTAQSNAQSKDQPKNLHRKSQQPLESCLVSFTGLSLTERVALNLGIPVLALEWIDDLHSQWKAGGTVDIKASIDRHAMGPLRGCSICVTGFPTDVRAEIQQFAINFGGDYTMDMIKGTTTHLVCDKPIGKKYTSALGWGIECVPYEWLLSTKQTLEYQDPEAFTISPDGYRSEPAGRLLAPINMGGDSKSSDVQAVNSVPEQLYLESCCIYLCESFRPEMATRLRKMICVGGGIHVKEYQSTEVTHVVVPTDTLHPQTLALFHDTTELPYIVQVQWLRGCNSEKKLLPESQYIVPFPVRNEDKLANTATSDAATLWTTDSAVQSSHSKPTKIASIRVSLRGASSTVAGMDYRETAPQNSDSSPAESIPTPISAPPSLSTPRLLRSRTESGVLAEALNDLSVRNYRSPASTHKLGAAQSSNTAQTSLQEERETKNNVMDKEANDSAKKNPVSNIFLGLHITSFGCKSAMTNFIKEETVAYGGEFFEQGEMPPELENRIHTIVPLARTRDTLKHIKGVVLTDCWFERSLEENRAITNYNYFMFSPLKTAPIPGFEKLSIALSTGSITEIAYMQTKRLIKVLGGTFHDKLHTIDTNLLISNVPSGPKYNFMSSSNRPIVTFAWLEACVLEGELLPYEKFFLTKNINSENGSKLGVKIKTEYLQPTQYGSQNSTQAMLPTLENYDADESIVPSDTPLSGYTIWIPTRISGNHRELCDLVTELGGRVVTSFHSSATHLVQKGKADKSTVRDSRLAQKERIKVVSPSWLYQCKESKTLVDEALHDVVYDEYSTIVQSRPSTRSTLPRESPGPVTRLGTSRSTGNIGSGVRSPGAPIPKRASTISSMPVSYSDLISTQTFQGTSAGATSAMFADSVNSSMAMSSFASANTSIDMTSADLSMAEANLPDYSDGVWRPITVPAPERSGPRKRPRRVAQKVEEESSTTPTLSGPSEATTPGEPMTIPEDFFDHSAKYGEGAVYWDDVEGRERKRALLESLGYKMPSRSTTSDDAKDVTMDHDEWRSKCTHLVTAGKNPARTMKLVIAQECQAHIVSKGFMIASAEQGYFVDEEPYKVFS